MQNRFCKPFLICIILSLLTSCQEATLDRDSVFPIQSDTSHPVSQVSAQLLVPLPSSGKDERSIAITDANAVRQILADDKGNLWTVGSGGVVQWYPPNGSFQKYTILDGLPENFITAIGIANNNHIWVGSFNGYISRYDGQRWDSKYPKLGEVITSLAFGKDGTIWVGTNRGISHYDGNQWVSFTTQQGLLDNYIQSIAITSNGIVWVGLIGGISYFDGKTWKSQRLDKGSVITQIVEASDKTIWFSSDNFLVHMRGDEFLTYQIDSLLKHVTAMAISPQGEIWFSNGNNMIGQFDEKNSSFTPYSIANISSMTFDQTGRLWLGSFDTGISQFDKQGQKRYQTEEGLIENFVISSEAAWDGTIWFGTCCGLSHFDGEEWKSYTKEDGLVNNSVLSIASAPDGSVWFGTEGGISHFDGSSWKNFDIRDGLPEGRITAITVAPDGSVWAGSQTGVSHYHAEMWELVSLPAGISSNYVRAIAIGRDGRVWVSIQNGFAVFDGSRWVVIDIGSNAPITTIAITDPGDMWLGTLRAGVLFISGELWEKAASAISEPTTNILLEPDGSVSIKNNIEKFPVQGISWQHFTEAIGLPSNTIYATYLDRNGAVWVATDLGISRIINGQVVPFSSEPALGNRKIQTIVQDQKGNLWFGMTFGGVISLKP
jgi:ligand-binding sensor domain-containing protein